MSSKLTLTLSEIQAMPSNAAVINNPTVRENWIETAVKTRGVSREEAEQRYEFENILFNKALTGYAFSNVTDRFSVYESAVMLNLSGLTLHEGEGYLIPMGNKCTFQVGWKGRLKQIQDNPNVRFAHQPELVYDCDEFDYIIMPYKAITRHKRGIRSKENKLTHVYFVIELKATDRPLVFIMEAQDVLAIRDNYSKSYNQYLKDKPIADKNGGKIVKKKKNGETYEVEIEVPMWVTDEAQAWRKTIIKHAYNSKLIPQSRMERDIDHNIVKINMGAGEGDYNVDEDTCLSDYTILSEEAPIKDQAEEHDPAPAPPNDTAVDSDKNIEMF